MKTERDQAVADNAALRELLQRLVRHEKEHPVHSHKLPRIWNDDNGDKSGTPCDRCMDFLSAEQADTLKNTASKALLVEIESLTASVEVLRRALKGIRDFYIPVAMSELAVIHTLKNTASQALAETKQ